MSSHSGDPGLPAGSSGDSGGGDLIGFLPDCILGHILSFLPTKDAARTTTLSSRWRLLWPSLPLSLSDADLRFAGAEIDPRPVSSIILSIVVSHRGPVHSFRLVRTLLDPAALETCVQTLAALSIIELILSPPALPQLLPAAFFRCATLSTAEIGNCVFPDPARSPPSFPRLTELTLKCVRLSQSDLEALIAGCPVLESLSLDRNVGYLRLRVQSTSLRSLTLSLSLACRDHGDELAELVIDAAANLERLLVHDLPRVPSITVISAPKLETLGYLGPGILRLLVGGDTMFKNLSAAPAAAPVHTVKTLAIELLELKVKPLHDMLQCFPRLEALYIAATARLPGSDDRSFNPQESNPAIDHLKMVVIRGYTGESGQVQVAKYLIKNVRMLEKLVLWCSPAKAGSTWADKQIQRIFGGRKQAPAGGVHVQFRFGEVGYLKFDKHARNLHLVNPFQIA